MFSSILGHLDAIGSSFTVLLTTQYYIVAGELPVFVFW
ncbi:hypothetical protein MYAER_3206 [Microcystis aeruginosa NIES-2549]|uniref:Uncharacterized protein n=1 Tax=Microcystis aeruginosa NIES-2549 TaxID=1641812 RepID=A0A0F6U6S1_MICAE|nr:hypothetical protein MYAER_3206 [Microcystis aeruginosa NIES-2549]AOC53958.1 hypothetical protein amyaer_3253 [Microcystis aeruginosa NIES-2481]